MMMTGVKELFLDTNILVYATNGAASFHQVANQTLQAANSSGVRLTVSTQISREYLATATRLSTQGVSFPQADILANLQLFQSKFKVIEDNLQVFSNLLGLVQNYTLTGKQVYDGNIVATMQLYGITHLLTHNVSDFNRYAGKITIIPLLGNTP
jgi:predicted nucleic acid-binding protein